MDAKEWTIIPMAIAAVVWLAERLKYLIEHRNGNGNARRGEGLSKADAERILRWVEQAPQAVATITGTLSAIAETQRELVRIHADQTEILNRLATEIAVVKAIVDRRTP